MTTYAPPAVGPTEHRHPPRAVVRSSARRVGALARAEAILLRRYPMGLLNALVVPVTMVLVVRNAAPADAPARGTAGFTIVAALVAFSLLLAVYYNLVTALVARREGLVLKRLRTGETSDAEILTGVATPAVAIAWAQSLAGVVAALLAFGLPAPVNPILAGAGILGGTAVFVLLATASTAITRTVEMAQVTTMPVLLVPMVLSGLFVPLDEFPAVVQRVADLTPLTAVLQLLRLGLEETAPDGSAVGFAASFGHGLSPLLVLAAWTAAAAWATRRCRCRRRMGLRLA